MFCKRKSFLKIDVGENATCFPAQCLSLMSNGTFILAYLNFLVYTQIHFAILQNFTEKYKVQKMAESDLENSIKRSKLFSESKVPELIMVCSIY